MEITIVKEIEFRPMTEQDYEGYAGAGEKAVINDEDLSFWHHGEMVEKCEAIVIIDEGKINIDMVGEDHEAEWYYDTRTGSNQIAIAMLSIWWNKNKTYFRDQDLKYLGFQQLL